MSAQANSPVLQESKAQNLQRFSDCCKLLWQTTSSLDIEHDAILSFRMLR